MAKDKMFFPLYDDGKWLFRTMLRVLSVLDSAKKEGIMLSEKQILEAAFPGISGNEELVRIAKFNIRRRLRRNLFQKVIVKKVDNFERSKTAYYGLR